MTMSTLKRPLVALLLAPDDAMWEAALASRKMITIREGHRDYQVGAKLLIGCHLKGTAFMASVSGVRHCKMEDVTAEERAADGFGSLEEAIHGLARFYPHITTESPVTVLRWKDPHGALVKI
jgi:hypothetical protein